MVKKPVREHGDAHMTTRVLVRDIMNSPVVTASPDDSLRDIARKMKEEKIGSIVIMENSKPLGIVTDWDIVSGGVVRDVKPGGIKAGEVMKDIHTIEGQEGITEAARLLRKHISSSDVIAVTPDLVDVVSEKAAIIRGELGISRPAGKVSGYCDECGEWSDLLQYDEGTFICEVCRGESTAVEAE